ncbi:hypothetical protein BJY01DRAFT_85723 [Aspergillus pseudoustus]|uniref:Uncharacterized protein n=1 Tax=Aspergillus pseudoustus TaxID=1810923 RepID=A0ABR4J2L2_9EURO
MFLILFPFTYSIRNSNAFCSIQNSRQKDLPNFPQKLKDRVKVKDGVAETTAWALGKTVTVFTLLLQDPRSIILTSAGSPSHLKLLVFFLRCLLCYSLLTFILFAPLFSLSTPSLGIPTPARSTNLGSVQLTRLVRR